MDDSSLFFTFQQNAGFQHKVLKFMYLMHDMHNMLHVKKRETGGTIDIMRDIEKCRVSNGIHSKKISGFSSGILVFWDIWHHS